LSSVPRLLGLQDREKMSKSLNNYVSLLEEPAGIWAKLRTASTDPARVRRQDPGTPEVCNIFTMHKAFSPPPDVRWSAEGCRTAGIGCLECKRRLADNMARELEPIRQRYAELAPDADRVRRLMEQGAESARTVARQTIAEVRQKAGLR
jgi:tryptophanyl-tRNA synthetase